MEAITRSQAQALLEALGGVDNILTIETCFTRLRVEVDQVSLLHLQDIERDTGCCGAVVRGTEIQLVYGVSAAQVDTILRAVIQKERQKRTL
ncbi:MAG: PTS transporter subunit EIIB [Faecalibacterium sp.]|jgi:PTS system arbutin-like IIC component|nr:PTS transporter subunit EIIB [Faecalibacterium sp.]